MPRSHSTARAGTVKAGPTEAELRSTLGAIAHTTDELAQALDMAGARERVRQSRHQTLHVLDHRLPPQTLEEFLLAIEAYARISGPIALASQDLVNLRSEARHRLQSLHLLHRLRREQRHTDETVKMQALALHAALSDPAVREAIERLADLFTKLATLADGTGARAGLELRIGTRFLVPGSIILTTLALILFFMGGIAFATGAVALTPHGVKVTNPNVGLTPAGTAHPQGNHSPTPTGTTTGAIPTSSTAAGSRTPTPPAATRTPQATPTTGGPVLTAAPTTVQPCRGTDDQFSLTYSAGSGSVTWTATSSNPTDVVLSTGSGNFQGQSSGTLQPGQSVTIYVRLLNDVAITGQVSVSGSHGANTLGVIYDSTNC
jgi:hypothetical protein